MAIKPTNDPFLDRFLRRLSPELAESFTQAQLAAVKIAFGGRAWGAHPVDIRTSFPFLWRRYYIVLIAGRERRAAKRRSLERREHPLTTFANGIVAGLFFLLIAAPLVIVVYAVIKMTGSGLPPGGFLHSMIDSVRQLFR